MSAVTGPDERKKKRAKKIDSCTPRSVTRWNQLRESRGLRGAAYEFPCPNQREYQVSQQVARYDPGASLLDDARNDRNIPFPDSGSEPSRDRGLDPSNLGKSNSYRIRNLEPGLRRSRSWQLKLEVLWASLRPASRGRAGFRPRSC